MLTPEPGSRFLWEAGDIPLQKRPLGYTEDYRDVRRATAVGAEAWRVPALGQGMESGQAAPAVSYGDFWFGAVGLQRIPGLSAV